MTHDLKYEITVEDVSVNNWINKEGFLELLYIFCLKRVIHYIVTLRRKFPTKRILLAKYDYSSVYCRISNSAWAASQSILVIDGIPYVFLRMAYGGSP